MNNGEQIDWMAIEVDYRAGVKSLRQLADEHNITHGAINKRAKRDKWERDLSGKIKAKAAQLISKAAVSSEVSAKRLATENEVVEANAVMQSDIILTHRTDIQRYRKLASKLLNEIEETSDNQDLFEKLSELLCDTAGDNENKNDAQAKRQELFNKILSIPNRVDSFKKLSETLRVLIALEREAFGIDDKKTLSATGDINISF